IEPGFVLVNPSTGSQHVAIGEHHFEPDHIISRYAVFQTARATRVRRDVPADRAIFHARRLGGIKKFWRARRPFQGGRKPPWLDDRNCIGKADFLDPIHPHKGQRNAAPHWYTSTDVTKSAAARSYRDFFARGELQQFTDVTCRSCEDDNFRFVRDEPLVTAVRSKRFWIISNSVLFERLPQLVGKIHLHDRNRARCIVIRSRSLARLHSYDLIVAIDIVYLAGDRSGASAGEKDSGRAQFCWVAAAF